MLSLVFLYVGECTGILNCKNCMISQDSLYIISFPDLFVMKLSKTLPRTSKDRSCTVTVWRVKKLDSATGKDQRPDAAVIYAKQFIQSQIVRSLKIA